MNISSDIVIVYLELVGKYRRQMGQEGAAPARVDVVSNGGVGRRSTFVCGGFKYLV